MGYNQPIDPFHHDHGSLVAGSGEGHTALMSRGLGVHISESISTPHLRGILTEPNDHSLEAPADTGHFLLGKSHSSFDFEDGWLKR